MRNNAFLYLTSVFSYNFDFTSGAARPCKIFNLANNDENIQLIAGGIANDLVLNAENSQHSVAQGKEVVVNLPATTSRSINSVSS